MRGPIGKHLMLKNCNSNLKDTNKKMIMRKMSIDSKKNQYLVKGSIP